MKKYTTFMLSIGILLSHSSISLAEDGDIPKPGDILPLVVTFLKASIMTAASHIITSEIVSNYNQSKKNGESWWQYYFAQAPKLNVVTHEQLKSRPELNINTFKSLPDKIQTILQDEKISNTGEHRPIILYGVPGTGKTTLAQQIALHTGGNYYHIHQQMLDGHSDSTVARFLRIYVNEISKQTVDGSISTLHLEEFGKQLGKSTENDMHNVEHGPFENTWKQLLQELETKYPKVRVIACSNFAKDNAKEQFNAAIANERAHVIRIDAPNDTARKAYFTTTCVSHLEKEGIKNAKAIVGSITDQDKRNQKLTAEYLVSLAMHDRAKQKHEAAIASTTTPWSLNALLWPRSWVEIYNKNKSAAKMKANGYVTSIVDWDLTSATPAQATEFANLTNGLRYRQLDAITESARRGRIEQIARMKERSTHPESAYTIYTDARTYSIKEDPQDPNNNDAVTTTFGQVQPRHQLKAAAYHKIDSLNQLKKEHPELAGKINDELANIDTHDLPALTIKVKANANQINFENYKDLRKNRLKLESSNVAQEEKRKNPAGSNYFDTQD